MSEPVIHVKNVGMSFRLHYERVDTLKEAFLGFLRKRNAHRDFWALDNVSFDVHHGEAVGILGRNGSGKSTLLKLIAGVFGPTLGTCNVNGRVAPLIELGAGFNGELTGRENVFLSGAIMGRSRADMAARYDRIVEFAELKDFMDVPVKNYSSGMYARLGFAIATDIDGDLLLIDEILGVGDEAFQKKSFARIQEQIDAGKTLMFVSHQASAVEKICKRCIVLHHGHLIFDGDTQSALAEYRKVVAAEADGPQLAIA